jgi:hypothetical protein
LEYGEYKEEIEVEKKFSAHKISEAYQISLDWEAITSHF